MATVLFPVFVDFVSGEAGGAKAQGRIAELVGRGVGVG
jgi:hypothetical protein